MATESSAVVRFISLAQQSQNPVRPTAPAPITSEFGTEVVREVRSKPSRAPLIVGAIALAGGAAIGGVYLGKSGFGGPDSPKNDGATKAAPAAAAPLAVAERAETTPAAPAVVAPEPAAAAPAPAPEVTTPAVAVPIDVLAATGFDIRVQPGATITLDGSVLGKAPLRVRNLQPGPHVLDLEAPPGFFSRRVDLALGAGEAKDLRLALDPIDDDTTKTAASDTASSQTSKSSKSSKSSRRSRADLRRERREKVREEQDRKKEMRAARAAAARAAKADKSEKKAAVVTEALPDEPKAREPARDEKMDAADAELEAAMADIVGKKAPKSAASAAGASSLAASSPAPSNGKGTLMLGSKPPCDIILDGRPTGLKTPQRAMELAPGTHSVVLVNAELGLEKKFKVKIAPGKTTKAIQDLTDKID
jgi:hypothetical protein